MNVQVGLLSVSEYCLGGRFGVDVYGTGDSEPHISVLIMTYLLQVCVFSMNAHIESYDDRVLQDNAEHRSVI